MQTAFYKGAALFVFIVALLMSLTTGEVGVKPPVSPTTTMTTLAITQAPAAATPTAIAIDPGTPLPIATAYITQRGDSLYRIAALYDVSVDAIIAVNNLSNPEAIQIGQEILIPGIADITATPFPTITPIQLMAEDLSGVTINGLPVEQVIVMPDDVKSNIRIIYMIGQVLGNNAHAFSKLGDSTIESPHFLTRFDTDEYNLGTFDYLQPTIDYYAGSFSRESVAVRRGLITWSVLDPMWANAQGCEPNENMLSCEFRLHRPSVLFIRLGTNDKGVPESTDKNIREIVEFTLSQGVIPVLGTKADRAEGPGNINNAIIRQIAADYHIPLWDFDLASQTLPDRGLVNDHVHMTTFYAHDWTLPEAMQRGHGVHNLTALMTLDMILRTVLNKDDPVVIAIAEGN